MSAVKLWNDILGKYWPATIQMHITYERFWKTLSRNLQNVHYSSEARAIWLWDAYSQVSFCHQRSEWLSSCPSQWSPGSIFYPNRQETHQSWSALLQRNQQWQNRNGTHHVPNADDLPIENDNPFPLNCSLKTDTNFSRIFSLCWGQETQKLQTVFLPKRSEIPALTGLKPRWK